jgi:predicted nucleic acid-binding protein
VLDANVFIEASRRYYAFDLAPGFWQSLIYHAGNGDILSIDRVSDELKKGKDELANWVKQNFKDAFASTDDIDIAKLYAGIMNWVNNQGQFSDAAKADFAKGADGWLVAYARLHGHTVVTHEELAPDVRRKVPIPNVCHAFNVPYIDTFNMLRSLGVRLN